MPDVVWEITGVETTGAGIDKRLTLWGEVGPRVLDLLAEWTRCDCAILRTEASDAQNLVLEGYKFGSHVSSSQEFKIPQRKSLRFWNGHAFTSCILQHHPQGTLDPQRNQNQESLEPEVERFLSRVLWRGSFPLAISDVGQRIAILISFEPQSPDWESADDMALAWLAGQLSVVQELASHARVPESFAQAARHLLALSYFASEKKQLASLLRILCSGRGLGWQRLWLMRSNGTSFECETCCGGVSLAEWGISAAYAGSNFYSLVDEIAHEVVEEPRLQDGLYRSCVLEKKLVADQTWFDWEEKSKIPNALFLTPTEMEFDGVNHWKNNLSQATGGSRTSDEDDERFYSCPFKIGDVHYIAVLAWSDTRTNSGFPHLIETGAILAVASRIMTDVRMSKNGSRASTVDDEPATSDFVGRLSGLLSWQGIAPLDPLDLEKAKARRVRARFEQSAEFRAAVGKKMLAAVALRDESSQADRS